MSRIKETLINGVDKQEQDVLTGFLTDLAKEEEFFLSQIVHNLEKAVENKELTENKANWLCAHPIQAINWLENKGIYL